MKRFFKELLRFIGVSVITTILLAGCIIFPDLALVFLGLILLFLILSIVFACLHKVSKAWAIDIIVYGILIVLFYLGVSFLATLFDEDNNRNTQLLEDFIKSPVSNIPDETVFNGMKRYGKDEWKELENEKLIVDKDGKPITGVVYEEMESIFGFKSIKNGKFDGYHLFYSKKNPKQLKSFSYAENNNFQELVILHDKGQPLLIGKITDEYIMSKHYSSDGKLLSAAFNDKILKPHTILYAYDKNGNQIIKMNTYEQKAVCILKDGSERRMTEKEGNQVFEENDKRATGKTDIPNYPCQWEEVK